LNTDASGNRNTRKLSYDYIHTLHIRRTSTITAYQLTGHILLLGVYREGVRPGDLFLIAANKFDFPFNQYIPRANLKSSQYLKSLVYRKSLFKNELVSQVTITSCALIPTRLWVCTPGGDICAPITCRVDLSGSVERLSDAAVGEDLVF
jgi:hypothetical protein